MYTTRFLALSRRAATVLSTLALALLLGNAGCGKQAIAILKINHVQELRSIQDDFNQAALLENQEGGNQSPQSAITMGAQATASYRSVLASLNKLLVMSLEPLKADNLLGNVYVLKALTEWRLGEFNAAMATIAKTEDKDISLQPRDKAIATAFRGLIMNDQAYHHMQNKSATYAEIRTLILTALSAFHDGIATLPRNHGMRFYLSLAQMGSIKNWIDLSGEPKRFSSDGAGPGTATETEAICVAFKPILATYKSEIDRSKARDAAIGARLEAQWNHALHIEVLIAACP